MVGKTISDSAFRNRICSFRIGSPVQRGGKRTFKTELPCDINVAINGYKVFNDPTCHSIEDIEPIPLDEDFFLRHEEIFIPKKEVYDCFKNKHDVTITKKEFICFIDGEEYGPIKRHEIKALLEDLCGISIPVFDGLF